MTPETLYEYYREQNVLPTHARFKTPEQLHAYAKQRTLVFTERLSVPTAYFQNKDVLEFGPDSGENSLVFASWGARCTLVEPNANAHPYIKDYFSRFALQNQLVALNAADLVSFESATRYDFVDAEGFIYTVKPDRLWMARFAQLLKPGGLALVSYYEPFGCFIELFLKVIYSRLRQLTGWGDLETAEKVFKAKWDSIPHTRAMQSWVMDVLENPFVRLKYFLEAATLCRNMASEGFSLYSSFPVYRDALEVLWIKKALTEAERLEQQAQFISQSRLSYLLGAKHFLITPSADVDQTLLSLVSTTDALIDEYDLTLSTELNRCFASVNQLLATSMTISDPIGRQKAIDFLQSVQRLLILLDEGSADPIVAFCNTDAAFIVTWGVPFHYAVFQKTVGA